MACASSRTANCQCMFEQPRLSQQHAVGRHHHVGVPKRLGWIGGHAIEFFLGRLGRMDEQGPKRRREPGHLRLPVGQQRRGENQKRRLCGLLVLQDRQQGQHLDGLAEPHVVGQARAEPQARQEPEPGDARLLILPQRRLELAPTKRRMEDFPGFASWRESRRATGRHGRTTIGAADRRRPLR